MAKYIELRKAFEAICGTECRIETKILLTSILLDLPTLDIEDKVEEVKQDKSLVKRSTVEKIFKQLDDWIRICPKRALPENYRRELISLVSHCRSMIGGDLK